MTNGAPPIKSHAACIPTMKDIHIMNDWNKKSQKYPQVLKHYSRIIQPVNEIARNWNYQPPMVDNAYYRDLIRDRVQPFQPEQVTPFTPSIVEKPIATPQKVIDFALASLTEAQKREHAATMFEMCKRLAYCWNRAIDINLNPDGLYYLFESYRWQCPSTGVTHSWRTPLSIEFIVHPFAGGRIALFNIRPRYNGLLPGEFRWRGRKSLAELAAIA